VEWGGGWSGVVWGGVEWSHEETLRIRFHIKELINSQTNYAAANINFGVNPIREGSWCVGGFVGGCGMRTIPFWSRANSTRSVGLDGRDAHENSAALEVRVA